ncbi:Krueppel-like factor 13 [Motacilla alba alba]|uniref:Krueppel-like factor 13 n=1 Tax=Motacilla alba alba TaxID=1094192 RepID=UPI0018D596CA|nr:Krueppel-like factor 13 [Motacilla alba alba]
MRPRCPGGDLRRAGFSPRDREAPLGHHPSERRPPPAPRGLSPGSCGPSAAPGWKERGASCPAAVPAPPTRAEGPPARRGQRGATRPDPTVPRFPRTAQAEACPARRELSGCSDLPHGPRHEPGVQSFSGRAAAPGRGAGRRRFCRRISGLCWKAARDPGRAARPSASGARCCSSPPPLIW